MPHGYSLHIALNKVDRNTYGADGLLHSCINNAKNYEKIALSQGFTNTVLLADSNASLNNFKNATEHIIKQLNNNDYFLLTFSGHGGKVKDLSNDEDGEYDQTWCFYDGEVIDDEFFDIWLKLPGNARVFVISDSCYSGSMLRDIFNIDPFKQQGVIKPINEPNNRGFDVDPFRPMLKACIKLLSGALENKPASDGPFYSLFTEALLNTWDNSSFSGNYYDFYEAIKTKMPFKSPPGWMQVGISNLEYDQQKPFFI